MSRPVEKVEVTSRVPKHLVDAFIENTREFFTKARGGTTTAQRAAEVRAQDHDAGLDSLVVLFDLARSDTGQAGIVARFLAGLYNGMDFPFDLTELRGLDCDLFEHCLAVLRLDNRPKVEIHRYLPDGEQRMKQLLLDWGLMTRPVPPPAAGEDYNVQYVTHGFAPGYRDVRIHVRFEGDAADAPATTLYLPAEDCARLTEDLLDIHKQEWQLGRRPLDAKAGEQRPRWLPM
jgi:hypothetical protein